MVLWANLAQQSAQHAFVLSFGEMRALELICYHILYRNCQQTVPRYSISPLSCPSMCFSNFLGLAETATVSFSIFVRGPLVGSLHPRFFSLSLLAACGACTYRPQYCSAQNYNRMSECITSRTCHTSLQPTDLHCSNVYIAVHSGCLYCH